MATADSDRPAPARPSYTIARVERAVRRAIAERVGEHGLTVPEYTALSVLRRRSGLSNAQLARRTYVTPQSMNAVLAGLQGRGLIARTPSRDHSRVLKTELTAAGDRLLAACETEVEAFEEEMLAVLTPRQREAFESALTKVAQQLEALHER
jgi:DNA-binding MarR family transcriptional regulator